MTLAEAERALGVKLKPGYKTEPPFDDCNYFSRADGVDPEIKYTFTRNFLDRIDIEGRQIRAPKGTDVRTPEGIGIGSPEAEIKSAYGSHVTHGQLGAGLYYDLVRWDGQKALMVFDVAGGVVTDFRTGYRGSVDAVVPCFGRHIIDPPN